MKTTPYERRFGDDCRSSWSRLLRPRINLGRNLGGVCDVYWAEIKTIKERKHIMKKNQFEGIDFAKNAENAETWLAAKVRLEEIRQSICERNVSYGELAELESLADYIESGDVQLLEWAGVPEFRD